MRTATIVLGLLVSVLAAQAANAQNTAPTAANGAVTTNENTDYVFSASDFNYSDGDGDPFSGIKVYRLPERGTLYVDADDDGVLDTDEEVDRLDAVTAATISVSRLKFKPMADSAGKYYAEFRFKVYDGTDYSDNAYNMYIHVVAISTGSRTFDSGHTFTQTTTSTSFWMFKAADFDGDGDLDVVASINSSTSGKVIWYKNNGSGTLTEQQTISYPWPRGICVGDMDGDGDIDIVTTSWQNKISWWANTDGAGTFGNETVVETGPPPDPPPDYDYSHYGVKAVDLDDDGDLDILTTDYWYDAIVWYVNSGSGSFGSRTTIGTASRAHGVEAADLDGDGDLDVIGASQGDGKVYWWPNNGGGSFGSRGTIASSLSALREAWPADLDNDGDLDVATASSSNNMFGWYKNDGTGSFTTQTPINNSASGAYSIYAADLDEDGDLDVFGTAPGATKIIWHTNGGTGNFAAGSDVASVGDYNRFACFGDFDGDGYLDVMSHAPTSGYLAWYRNISANTPPIINNLHTDASDYTEGDGAVIIDQGDTVSVVDAESTDFDTGTLTVSITGNRDTEEDVLAIRNQGTGVGEIGVSGSYVTYNAGSGSNTVGEFTGGSGSDNLVVTFSGTNSTPAAVSAVTANITYENTDTLDPTEAVRTISFVVTDGDGGTSTPALATVAVTGTNDPPAVGTNTGVTVNEGGTVTIDETKLQEADPDDSGTGLTYTVTSGTTNGQLELTTGAGTPISSFTQDDLDKERVVYVHNGSETTSDAFDFSLADGGENGAGPATGTFNITVTPVNDPPTVSTNTGATVDEGGTVTIDNAKLDEGDPDDSGVGLTYTITSGPANGQVELSGVAGSSFTQDDVDNNRVVFRHDGSETTSDAFDFSLADGGEDPATGTFSITVTPQNDNPAITEPSPVSVTMSEDGDPTPFALTLHATDAENDTLTWSISSAAPHGTATASGTGTSKAIGYSPQADYYGADTFEVQVDDGNLGTAAVTVNVTVEAVNDPPTIATNTGATVDVGGTVTIDKAKLNGGDPDDSGVGLTYTVVSGPSNGQVGLTTSPDVAISSFTQDDVDSNLVVYVHDGSETTWDAFDFSLADGGENGAGPATGTFSIMVVPDDQDDSFPWLLFYPAFVKSPSDGF